VARRGASILLVNLPFSTKSAARGAARRAAPRRAAPRRTEMGSPGVSQ